MSAEQLEQPDLLYHDQLQLDLLNPATRPRASIELYFAFRTPNYADSLDSKLHNLTTLVIALPYYREGLLEIEPEILAAMENYVVESKELLGYL